MIPFLACLDLDIQSILLWRQRTGSKLGKRAWRIFGLIKIQHNFSVYCLVSVQKPARSVSLGLARQIAKNDEEFPLVLNRLERVFLFLELES